MISRWAVLCAVLGAGCPSDDGEAMESGSGAASTSDPVTGSSESSTGELPEVDYEMDIQPLLNTNCTCHLMGPSGTMTAPFMTLNPGMSYAQIVDVPSEQSDLVRVAPGDLEPSYLWHKLEGTHEDVGGEGTPMPQTGPLEDAELELVRAWILRGAMP